MIAFQEQKVALIFAPVGSSRLMQAWDEIKTPFTYSKNTPSKRVAPASCLKKLILRLTQV